MHHRTRSRLSLFTFCLVIATGLTDRAWSQCGKKVQIRSGETLSDLAERCDITEAGILDLNPNIEGSKDLRAGMVLDLAARAPNDVVERTRDTGDDRLLGRLKSYAEEASQTLKGEAEAVKQSVEQFIAQDPDMHQRVRRLGERLNIPGLEKVDAHISLSARKGAPGSPVTLSAIGLPRNQRVEIAGGVPGSAIRILESARTSAEGTLQVTVLLPEWADYQRDFIFVIANHELNVAARSAAFNVERASDSR